MNIAEDIWGFIDRVNHHIYDHPDLTKLNCGGCGWYAYYMKRELERRWGKEAIVEFQYLNGWYEGFDYARNILNNLAGHDCRVSASHVILKVTIPSLDSDMGVFYFDSEDIYYDAVELEEMGYELEEPFDIATPVYRKGALEESAWQWNDWYHVKRGNKAIRECIQAY